jgi:hypothetical protein
MQLNLAALFLASAGAAAAMSNSKLTILCAPRRA